MNVLLLAVPFGWLAYFLHWDPIAVFVLVSNSIMACIIVMPLTQGYDVPACHCEVPGG